MISPSAICSLRLRSDRTYQVFRVHQNDNDCRYFGRFIDDAGTLEEGVYPITLDDGYHDAGEYCLAELHDGRILFSCAFHDCSTGNWNPFALALVYYSDDQGESWALSPQMIIGPLSSATGLQKPNIIVLKNGYVMLWADTNLGMQYQSVSSDRGITWTQPEPKKELS